MDNLETGSESYSGLRKKEEASPTYTPAVSKDTDWDLCFHLSEPSKIPAHQQTDELYPTGGSETVKALKPRRRRGPRLCLFPKRKQPNHTKKQFNCLRGGEVNSHTNKELTHWAILSQVMFGEEHWKCTQALVNLAMAA